MLVVIVPIVVNIIAILVVVVVVVVVNVIVVVVSPREGPTASRAQVPDSMPEMSADRESSLIAGIQRSVIFPVAATRRVIFHGAAYRANLTKLPRI